MPIQVGQNVWLPCEVKPGPFSDERLVRIETEPGREWVGFVPARLLKEPIQEGRTYVKAVVTVVRDDTFAATLPGSAVTSGMFEGQMSRVERVGSV